MAYGFLSRPISKGIASLSNVSLASCNYLWIVSDARLVRLIEKGVVQSEKDRGSYLRWSLV